MKTLSAIFLASLMASMASAQDVTPPNITGFSFTPPGVDVTGSDQIVTCSIDAADAGDGVAEAGCVFVSPNKRHMAGCVARSFNTGSAASGNWQCDVTIKADSDGGAWKVSHAFANDLHAPKNRRRETGTDLGASTLTVTSTNADITDPDLTAFAVTLIPDPLYSVPGGTVQCTNTATDEVGGSGIQDSGCTFVDPDGNPISCISRTPVSGDDYMCSMDVPPASTPGVWALVNTWARDLLGNLKRLVPSEVTGIGGPTSFTVASGAGGTGGTGGAGGAGGTGGTGGTAGAGGSGVDPSGLIAEYRFQDPSPLADTSGNGFDLSATTATLVPDGRGTDNDVYSCDGNDTLGHPIESNFDLSGDLTLAAWAKVNSADLVTNWDRLVGKGDNSWSLEINNSGPMAGTIDNDYHDFSNVLDDSWHHLAMVFDDTANTVVLYVDGVVDSSGTTSNSLGVNDSTFQICHNSGYGSYIIGSVDDVYVWNRTLDITEINQLKDYGVAPCVPDSAAVTCAGLDCGFKNNNCNTPVDCDPYGATCGGSQTCFGNLCCTLATCSSEDCGSGYDDSCGGTLDCDAELTTCAVRHSSSAWVCNPLDDQCCDQPDPETVTCSGVECGTVIDACGQTIDCDTYSGGCSGGTPVCDQDSNTCVAQSPFPTAADTGITDYWCPRWNTLKSVASGNDYIDTPGEEREYVHHSGSYNLETSNYLLNCVKVDSTTQDDDGGVIECRASNGCTGGLAENTQIDLVNPNGVYGSSFSSITGFASWRRVHGQVGCDGSKFDGGLFQDSFIESRQTRDPYPGFPLGQSRDGQYCGNDINSHHDAVQSSGYEGQPTWFINNRIEGMMLSETSAWISGENPHHDWTFDHNWFQGGNYTIYYTEPWTRTRFTNNAILYNSWNQNINGSPGAAFYGAIDFSFDCFEFENNVYYTGLEAGGPFVEGGPVSPIWGGTVGQGGCTGGDALPAIPVLTISGAAASSPSCTEGDAGCNNISLSASLSTNKTGGSKRWRYNCGGSPGNTASLPCSETPDRCPNNYQDDGADLWYRYPLCDGSSSCTFTDVCDMQSESAGTYTMKVYAESGPGGGIRPSDHAEVTFTVNP